MIEYIINKEKRTVVAMIKFDSEETFKDADWIYDELDNALRKFKRCKFSDKKYCKNSKKMYFPTYMSAKAKCNPEDEWDEEYGKAIARQRLVEKIRKYLSNSYKIIANIIDELSNFVH